MAGDSGRDRSQYRQAERAAALMVSVSGTKHMAIPIATRNIGSATPPLYVDAGVTRPNQSRPPVTSSVPFLIGIFVPILPTSLAVPVAVDDERQGERYVCGACPQGAVAQHVLDEQREEREHREQRRADGENHPEARRTIVLCSVVIGIPRSSSRSLFVSSPGPCRSVV